MSVHNALGPGLLESTYEICLAVELSKRGIRFKRQRPMTLEPIHIAQVVTYLRLSDRHVGLLINFNERLLKYGIRRLAWGPPRRN